MALTGQPFDVPLSTLWQQSPPSAPLIGRLTSLVNAKVVKFTSGAAAGEATGSLVGRERLRVEKRDGFTRQPTASVAQDTGIATGFSWDTPSLLAPLNNQLAAVVDGAPWVFAPTQGKWTRYPTNHIQTNKLTEKTVYTANSQAVAADQAYMQSSGTTMYAWVDTTTITGSTNGVKAIWVDDTGTVLRGPLVVNNAGLHVRVASDGTNFWMATDVAGTTTITVFDPSGRQLATLDLPGVTAAISDLVNSAALGVVASVAVNAQSQPSLYFLSYSTSITATRTTDATIVGNSASNFITNDTGDGALYLATLNNASSTWTLHVYQISSSAGTQTHHYNFGTVSTGSWVVSQVAGHVLTDGSGSVTIAYTTSPSGVSQRTNSTAVLRCTTGGSLAGPFSKPSCSIVSRAFRVPGDATYSMVVNVSSPNALQSTYFLMDCEAEQNLLVSGQFQTGSAYANWLANDGTGNSNYWWLPASVSFDQTGAAHFPMSYTSESFTSALLSQLDAVLGLVSSIGGPGNAYSPFVNTVGIVRMSISTKYGQSVSFANEMLVPGLQAGYFDGLAFTEDGVCLGFEGPTLTATTGGSLTPSSSYQIVVVPEWTDNDGNRVRGVPSPPVNVTLNSSQNAISITGYSINMTGKTNVMISIYSSYITGGAQATVSVNGTQSIQHRKVTSDLNPMYNDPSSSTWTYLMTVSDTAISVGEILYTDKGLFPRTPAPAFSQGCVWKDRVWLSGYDGAIWFSGEKTEGDALWFTPAQRVVMPTQEQWVLAPMDSFLLAMGTDSKTMYVIESGTLLDPTGATGSIPTPTLLPFASGCTGFTAVGRDGAFYSSTSGGVWLITRDLRNVQVSAGAVDYFTGTNVIGMAIDQNQRVAALTSDHTLQVWDTISQTWAQWSTSATTPAILGQWQGSFIFGASDGAWVQTAGTYADVGSSSTAIITSFGIAPINLGSVQGFKRIWAAQFLGTYLGDHNLTVVATYAADSLTRSATYAFRPVSNAPYRYELPPLVELCSSVAYSFTDSFPNGPSQGFALEMLSLYLGTEKGLAKLPIAQRIQPTGGTT